MLETTERTERTKNKISYADRCYNSPALSGMPCLDTGLRVGDR